MSKVLFLDIDGVLNRDGTRERCGPYIGVDRVLAKLFTDWLKTRPDVAVVLSSTWRKDQFLTYGHKDHLRDAGITWVDVTPVMNGSRGIEIARFLNTTGPISHFAILDDLGPTNFLPDQKPFLVQTDPDVGVTADHLTQLDRIFSCIG